MGDGWQSSEEQLVPEGWEDLAEEMWANAVLGQKEFMHM